MHFERRVNDALNACTDIERIILDYNYVVIMYKENSNVKSPKKIQGFYLTSNKNKNYQDYGKSYLYR